MQNATDFINSVYDTLAKILNLNNATGNVFMQMAWPGYSLSPTDFKPANAPNGPYDTNVAEQTFSALADIVPTFDKSVFENSGFTVDDIYEILVASAIPNGSTPDTISTNPLYTLFSNASFNLLSSKKGSIDDPNVFYYPCVATPNNWYTEAAANAWPTININSTTAAPAPQPNKTALQSLIGQGVWKLKPTQLTPVQLKANIQMGIDERNHILTNKLLINTVNIKAKPVAMQTTTLHAASPINNTAHTNSLVTRDTKALFTQKTVPTNVFAGNAIKTVLQNATLTQNKFTIAGASKPAPQLNYNLTYLLNQQLPVKPASPASTGFSISFKYCLVNIERHWLNLALLSTPNWYMYGYTASEYSNGSADNNPGMFPLLPTSLIVIRNLKITANWSPDDKANMANSVSFGPFDIRNATFNQDTIETDGLQVIAWISKVTPPLAPMNSI